MGIVALDELLRRLRGGAESAAVALLYIAISSLTNLRAEWSARMLRHYVAASAALLRVEPVPEDWQTWIVKQVGRRAGTHMLKPYKSGIFDLRNALGHFSVQVTLQHRLPTYQISDRYAFPDVYYHKDRHGFPISGMSSSQRELLKRSLPKRVYKGSKSGFVEQFEVKRVGREFILYVPQPFLEDHGRSFPVAGSFVGVN
jgi:hypothetical protein